MLRNIAQKLPALATQGTGAPKQRRKNLIALATQGTGAKNQSQKNQWVIIQA